MTIQASGDGNDTQSQRDTSSSRSIGLTGEQIALILNEVKDLKKALTKQDDEFIQMMAKTTRERQHTFVRPGNQSQYDFTNAVLWQVQEVLRGLKLIRIADHSKYDWAVDTEYETDELALDSDDKKK